MTELKELKISIPVHTVVTLVGPSNCGKSFWAYLTVENLKRKYPQLNFHIVSSDTIRRQLIGEDLHKHSDEMLYASQAAFNVLYNYIRNLLSFPLSLKNAVAIIDTTGMSEEFRNDINAIAKEFQYNTAAVVFDYKEYQDYFKFCDEDAELSKKVISNHVKRLRTKVLPTLRQKDYSAGVFKIKKPIDYSFEAEVELSNVEDYLNCWLPLEGNSGIFINDKLQLEYSIISDPHGCYDEFILLLEKLGFTIQDGLIVGPYNKRVIVQGDWIDKGPKVAELIKFLYYNKNYFTFVKGNHEDWVLRYLDGDIKGDDKALQFFDSANWLKGTEELSILRSLYEKAKPFVIYPGFICTHAPCEMKYLGKLDKESLKQQLKRRYPYSSDYQTDEDYKAALEDNLGFMRRQAVSNFPFIFSGHVAIKEVGRIGSQVMLDTGAVYGNKLTACTPKNGKLYFTEVETQPHVEEKILISLFDRKQGTKLDELEPSERRKITAMLGTIPRNFISGTMSPSANNETDLEPIVTALEYFKDKGVTEVVVQPKFMGSRCQFYWKPNKEDCYFTSRNGFVITHVDLSSVVEKFHPLVKKQFPEATLVILDGELLPWSALGKGLIDEHFEPIYYGMKTELEFMRDKGFNSAFSKLIEEAKTPEGFTHDRVKMSKKDLREKYGDSKVEWYEAGITGSRFIKPTEVELAEVEKYKVELDGYTKSGEVSFEPFQVLKVETENGVEILPFDNREGFELFNSKGSAWFKIGEEKEFDLAKGVLPKLYKEWVENSQDIFGYEKLEGVVIKPLNPKLTDVAPYIKVRNPEYLRLVYGPLYQLEPAYSKILNTKRIGRKLKASIEEWNLGMQMLSIPYNKLTIENTDAVDLMVRMMGIEKQVSELDPRL